ncbi:MAG: AAA family ATPase [Candidatus Margulisiibacteriota bacterium]
MNSRLVNIEINPEFKSALDLMENTNKNIFITGRAGTGKSTLLEYFRQHTKKRVAVLAPTGVAALNVRGQTIHSFFRFKPDITLSKVTKIIKDDRKNIYKKLDALVIDEISMVRADLLDCVDKFLRLNRGRRDLPFGGLQMIFIGDLYQLPPVITYKEKEIFKEHYKTGYFFSAHAFDSLKMELLELEKIYRQKDQKFIDLLNAIRNNTVGEDDLARLNTRVNQNFEPRPDDFYVHLTPTKLASQEINERQLEKIKGKPFYYRGEIDGGFEESHLPTEIDLYLKKGAQVMLLNNDSLGRWVNGSIGKVAGIEKGEDKHEPSVIYVELADGNIEAVTPFTWEIFNYSYNPKLHQLESEITGSFTQYPLKLAWSVTIHKSQGKTFDKVVVDIGKGTFAHGQVYVALSRCTSFEGLILKKLIHKKHIFMDWKVVDFITKFQYKRSEEELPLSRKVEILKNATSKKTSLKITYLKASDEKSSRVIKPLYVGELEYGGKTFLGVEAFCQTRQDKRVFRLDRILSISEAPVK